MADDSDDYIHFDLHILLIREKSVKVETLGGDEVWLPRSVVHGSNDVALTKEWDIGEVHNFQVRRWFAKQEGMI